VKRIIAAALEDRDIPYIPDRPLDFFLPIQQLHIHIVPGNAEPRALDQAKDVIVVRGRTAVNALAEWIRRGA
jgi:hypothetical protein